MRNATDETVRRALAFILITGRKTGLTYRLRVQLMDYLVEYDGSKEMLYRDRLTPEGEALARGHRLWKAHEHLTALGFVLDASRRRQKLSHVSYVHKDNRGRNAYAGVDGRVGVQHDAPDGKWARDWDCLRFQSDKIKEA